MAPTVLGGVISAGQSETDSGRGSAAIYEGKGAEPETSDLSKSKRIIEGQTNLAETFDLLVNKQVGLLLGGRFLHSPSSMVTSSMAMSPSIPAPRTPSITT